MKYKIVVSLMMAAMLSACGVHKQQTEVLSEQIWQIKDQYNQRMNALGINISENSDKVDHITETVDYIKWCLGRTGERVKAIMKKLEVKDPVKKESAPNKATK